MKFAAALLVAVVFASAVMAREAEPRGLREDVIAKAKELQAKVQEAIAAGKGKLQEVAAQLGVQNKEDALAKLNELKAQLQAKLKELLGPQVDKAKQQAAAKLREQLEKAVQRLQGLIAKLQKPQQ